MPICEHCKGNPMVNNHASWCDMAYVENVRKVKMVNCKNCKYWDSGVIVDVKDNSVGMCNLSATDSGYTYHPDNFTLPYMFEAHGDEKYGTLITGAEFGCVAGIELDIMPQIRNFQDELETGCFEDKKEFSKLDYDYFD